jgi:hypothetical protein
MLNLPTHQSVVLYLIIGTIFSAFVDITYWMARRIDPNYDKESENQLTNGERVYTILLWPLAVITMIRALIRTFTK